jgi:hypothetical protein
MHSGAIFACPTARPRQCRGEWVRRRNATAIATHTYEGSAPLRDPGLGLLEGSLEGGLSRTLTSAEPRTIAMEES